MSISDKRFMVMCDEDVKKDQLQQLNYEQADEDAKYDENELRKRYRSFYNVVVKRCLDFLFALIAIIIFSPVLIIVALAIIIDTGLPVFYRAERGGYKDRNFRIFKFRTMIKNADKIGGGTTALNDSRITKVGKILRKTKLDELAQLFNILSGKMSFIGPRPELTRYTDNYDQMEKNILMVRPGLSDYSSIQFINLDEIVGEGNADEIYEKYVYKKKNQLRLKYVSKISFFVDAGLFFKTIFQVIKKCFRVLFRKKK